MVQLVESDIRSREVLRWRGVHLFHYVMSSCSQKLRICMNMKGIEWQPHPVDLATHENNGEWFMGINPRGLVPVLVLDGAVHVESNDIIALLESAFPERALFPPGREAETAALLRHEDDLHLALRTLSFRFVHGRTGTTKTPEILAAYRALGSGTVGGEPDTHREVEIAFYERLARSGLDDATCRRAALEFRAAFDVLDERLAGSAFLLGDVPGALDVAWFVYAYRLDLGGYPLARLHPRVEEWYRGLAKRPDFVREVEPPAPLRERIRATRAEQERTGTTLSDVAGF